MGLIRKALVTGTVVAAAGVTMIYVTTDPSDGDPGNNRVKGPYSKINPISYGGSAHLDALTAPIQSLDQLKNQWGYALSGTQTALRSSEILYLTNAEKVRDSIGALHTVGKAYTLADLDTKKPSFPSSSERTVIADWWATTYVPGKDGRYSVDITPYLDSTQSGAGTSKGFEPLAETVFTDDGGIAETNWARQIRLSSDLTELDPEGSAYDVVGQIVFVVKRAYNPMLQQEEAIPYEHSQVLYVVSDRPGEATTDPSKLHVVLGNNNDAWLTSGSQPPPQVMPMQRFLDDVLSVAWDPKAPSRFEPDQPYPTTSRVPKLAECYYVGDTMGAGQRRRVLASSGSATEPPEKVGKVVHCGDDGTVNDPTPDDASSVRSVLGIDLP